MEDKLLKIASYYSPGAEKLSRGSGNAFYFNGAYLHGRVETLCGYDICYLKNPEDFKEETSEVTLKFSNRPEPIKERYVFLQGVYPCIVDDTYWCTGYFWYDREEVMRNVSGETQMLHSDTQKGLIVLNTDKKGKEDAKEKYTERKEYV